MLVNIPTGKTINISVYEYLFVWKDEDMDEFYQMCIAEDLGNHLENPFSSHNSGLPVEVEEEDF